LCSRRGRAYRWWARPLFRLEGSEGGRELFFRVTGIVALGDGFVVANTGASELHFSGATVR
jgi:hypothetical protein